MKKTQAAEARRDEHMANAINYTNDLVRDAELRGLSGYDLAVSISAVLAARNPTLCGKVLVAVGNAIRAQPVTKIVKPSEADTIELQRQADGSYGPPN